MPSFLQHHGVLIAIIGIIIPAKADRSEEFNFHLDIDLVLLTEPQA